MTGWATGSGPTWASMTPRKESVHAVLLVFMHCSDV